MTPNELDIHLLQNDPGKLIVRYQPLVKLIVRQFVSRGCGNRQDFSDLVQDVNRKLVERMPRIRHLYNHKSLFRTYFSVVIRNIYLEEARKIRQVAEPVAESYQKTTFNATIDHLLIRQESERLEIALNLFGPERALLYLCMRSLLELEVRIKDLKPFQVVLNDEELQTIADDLNKIGSKRRSEKFETLGKILTRLGERQRNGDALRKWYMSRTGELLNLMNGNPPKSAYTMDIIQILMEKSDTDENK